MKKTGEIVLGKCLPLEMRKVRSGYFVEGYTGQV